MYKINKPAAQFLNGDERSFSGPHVVGRNQPVAPTFKTLFLTNISLLMLPKEFLFYVLVISNIPKKGRLVTQSGR